MKGNKYLKETIKFLFQDSENITDIIILAKQDGKNIYAVSASDKVKPELLLDFALTTGVISNNYLTLLTKKKGN